MPQRFLCAFGVYMLANSTVEDAILDRLVGSAQIAIVTWNVARVCGRICNYLITCRVSKGLEAPARIYIQIKGFVILT